MRIAIITNAYPPNLNGVSVAVYNLEQAMKKIGLEVYIITPRIKDTIYNLNVFPVASTPTPKVMSGEIRIPIIDDKVRDFLKQKQIQLIHSQDTMMGGMETILLATELNIPCIHTYHTLIETYDYFKFMGYKQFIRSYSQIVCNSHDAIICLSSKIKRYLKIIGVKNKIYNLPNIFTPPENNQIKDINFITQNKLEKTFNIITFGRVAKEKNLLASIKLLEPLFKHYTKIKYIIAGDGPELEQLKKYVKKNKLERNVFFYGKYSRNNLGELCGFSQFKLITSYSEVLPTTPLEAMNNNLPVVCVNDIAFDYLLKDSYNGYYQKLSSLVYFCEKLYLDPQLLEIQKNNAKDTANQWINKDVSEEYKKMYQEVLENYQNKSIKKHFVKEFYINYLNLQNYLEGRISKVLTRPHL